MFSKHHLVTFPLNWPEAGAGAGARAGAGAGAQASAGSAKFLKG